MTAPMTTETVIREIIFRTPGHGRPLDGKAASVWIDTFIAQNLAYEIDLGFERPPPAGGKHIDKSTVRKWLNRNCTGTWTWTMKGAAFSDPRDATFFKLHWR